LSSFDLSEGIMTSDIGKALEFSQKVEAGTVWVNCYNQVCCQAGSFFNTEYVMISFVLVHISKGNLRRENIY
jgi:hypothetical protein